LRERTPVEKACEPSGELKHSINLRKKLNRQDSGHKMHRNLAVEGYRSTVQGEDADFL